MIVHGKIVKILDGAAIVISSSIRCKSVLGPISIHFRIHS